MSQTGDDVVGTKTSPGSSMDQAEPRPKMGWLKGTAIGFGIFAYFMVFTVWIPSAVLKLDGIVTADLFVQDLVVTVVWSLALGILIVGLRKAQRRGYI